MTADYLFTLGQYYLLDEDIGSAIRFLRLANAKDHEEATWLISLIDQTPFIETENGYNEIVHWCRSLFDNDDSDRALCYRLWFDTVLDLELSKYAADTGNAVGQYHYYMLSYRRENPKDLIYLEKAAAQNFPKAIEELAKRTWSKIHNIDLRSRRAELFLRGAELGNFFCIKKISELYAKITDPSKEDKINAAKWICRSYIWGDRSVNFADDLNLIGSRLNLNYIDNIYYYFTVGREADGYDEFFPIFNEKEYDALCEASRYYRMILSAARESSLCTLWTLRPILSKDVATVIAKMVYDSRLDPMVWIRTD